MKSNYLKNVKKRDVIFCSNSNKHYWDEAGIIRIFEKVLDHNITYEKAKAKYPNIVKVFQNVN